MVFVGPFAAGITIATIVLESSMAGITITIAVLSHQQRGSSIRLFRAILLLCWSHYGVSRFSSIDKSRIVGAQSLVAIQNSSGSMCAYTSPITSIAISTLTEGKLSFDVPMIRAEFLSGQASVGGGVGNSKRRRRNATDPAWFYLHAFCQSSAYTVGVSGWGTSLKIGGDSPGITYDKHRNIGINLFCLGTFEGSMSPLPTGFGNE
ncbi:hypothetical protein AG4045_025034 [Apium graveolens]|uniref:Uncharacterized protein n=1 Tax=Apium graveolens TaxID=4045 RepID=A0A6L5BB11_APIGR|nr:hypothetical protein AG4045_025034 [Apium graveolens]